MELPPASVQQARTVEIISSLQRATVAGRCMGAHPQEGLDCGGGPLGQRDLGQLRKHPLQVRNAENLRPACCYVRSSEWAAELNPAADPAPELGVADLFGPSPRVSACSAGWGLFAGDVTVKRPRSVNQSHAPSCQSHALESPYHWPVWQPGCRIWKALALPHTWHDLS